MNQNTITQESIYVKTGPTAFVVIDSPDGLYEHLSARLAKGEPFVTAAGAWQGYEEICHINGWQIGLTVIGKEIWLQANTRTELLPRLPLALRLGRGQYEVRMTREAFDVWVSGVGCQGSGNPAPLFDLLIASKKYGRGATSQADALIEWWKLAGQEKQVPPRATRLTDPVIQKKLLAYEFVTEEVQEHRIIRKYRKLPAAQA